MNLKSDIDNLRHILLLVFIASIIFPAYADVSPPADFGMKIIPGKIVENSEGEIEVYSTTGDIPVNGLIATSSNPLIVPMMFQLQWRQICWYPYLHLIII